MRIYEMSWLSPLYTKKITEHRDKWKIICKGWNRLAFHYKLKYRPLVDETYEDQEEGGRRRNNIRGRNRRFA
jgi:hypothetical protein